MIVQTDYSGLSQTGVPLVGPAAKRAAVAPAREGDRSQEDRRQQQQNQNAGKDGRPVFRSLLTDNTLAGLNATSAKPVKSLKAIEPAQSVQFVRPEKRPQQGPAAINEEDKNAVFSYLAASKRNAEIAQNSEGQSAGPLPQAFVEATTRYAQQAVATANLFAGRGETLELQA